MVPLVAGKGIRFCTLRYAPARRRRKKNEAGQLNFVISVLVLNARKEKPLGKIYSGGLQDFRWTKSTAECLHYYSAGVRAGLAVRVVAAAQCGSLHFHGPAVAVLSPPVSSLPGL